ncbi:MAG: DUF5683 domain-containing protein [Candidatus Cryptobacteroides sp.]
MTGKILRYILPLLLSVFMFRTEASAQFREEAFTQTYNDRPDSTARADTSDKLFSFKELFGGVAHKQDLRIGTMFAGSIFLPGISQIYNRDYYKLPIIYGGIGICAGLGGHYLNVYNKSVKLNAEDAGIPIDYKAKQTGTWLLTGAGLIYWGSLMDGVICYKKDIHPHPGRATIYSILLPGLGQAYNGEYWKIPIYYGGLVTCGYCLYTYNTNYVRFKRIHNEATSENNNSPISADTAKWYRDVYRRYRDYSIFATIAVYLLQIIDANVFAYMHDFEVSDEITMQFEPTVIAPENNYAMQSSALGGNAIGLRLGIRF